MYLYLIPVHFFYGLRTIPRHELPCINLVENRKKMILRDCVTNRISAPWVHNFRQRTNGWTMTERVRCNSWHKSGIYIRREKILVGALRSERWMWLDQNKFGGR